ncbi:MAG: inositol-3-phosphate synthase [bacterium]
MKRRQIKVAIVGVGNCASSLIQGIYFYDKTDKNNVSLGLLHNSIGGYKPMDIRIVAAFDIDERKVSKDVSEAIFAKPNNTKIFQRNIPKCGVKVLRGPTLDGYPEHFNNYDKNIRPVESIEKEVDVIKILKKIKPDILINYLPVGSQKASEYYAQACIDAEVSFVNAIPVFLCSTEQWSSKFTKKGLVCAGDDIKSQVGATIIHRVLANLFKERGVKLTRTYQLNIGGNTDFLNMVEESRLLNKRISKTEAVQSQLAVPLEKENIHIGPSDFVEWLHDNKVCYITMEGKGFGNMPITLDLKLSVEDSPNSAGVMIDVIRVCKLALDKGQKGYLSEISAFAFKHPSRQYSDDEAIQKLENFIRKYS